jgi:hypothetical protein
MKSLRPTTLTRSAGSARAFTLTEMIVAVGAVALLTVGVGQLFSSVQRLVGGGAAVAETDQLARAIANRLQQDFEALGSMQEDETFLVIRNRRMGDVNRNGQRDNNERAVYLRLEDREADQRAGVDPYAQRSRATTVRLDEMTFLGFSGGDRAFESAQLTSPGGGSSPTSQVARIYWGHGLKPAVNQSFDPFDPGSGPGPNTSPRTWVADGDFGQPPGAPNRFDPANTVNGGLVTGRNTFAGDWILLRQATLLYGGLATGYPPPSNGAPFSSRINYTPYIRDLETGIRSSYWPFQLSADGSVTASSSITPRPNPTIVPMPRLSRMGRVDICAQSLEDVRRWLEGLEAGSSATPVDATAFTSGRVEADTTTRWVPGGSLVGAAPADAPLWQRVNAGTQESIQLDNRRSLMSAVAGTITRYLAESRAGLTDRGDTLRPDAGVGANGRPLAINQDYREAALMDAHAVIASRVESLEIAWAYDKTWPDDDPADTDGDGVDDLFYGDPIWYDINFTRFPTISGRDLADIDTGGLVLGAGDDPVKLRTRPEVAPGLRNDVSTGLNTSPGQAGRYDPVTTGGDPTVNGDDEYLAIFPFQIPDQFGGYREGTYKKPARIRVRMTVHDAQFRIPGGRTYEFILPITFK